MATAIIGIGNLGGAVARLLASGGEPVILSASSQAKARKAAAAIGIPGSAALNNRDAVQRADNVVLALWLDPMREVIDEVADLLPGKVVIDPSNPIRVGAGRPVEPNSSRCGWNRHANASRRPVLRRTGGQPASAGNKVREGIRLSRGNHACIEFTSNPKARGSLLRDR